MSRQTEYLARLRSRGGTVITLTLEIGELEQIEAIMTATGAKSRTEAIRLAIKYIAERVKP